jgi:cell wall-associated NlpC family hydrolase
VSLPSYFDDPQKAGRFREEALSWVGTPFRAIFPKEGEHIDTKGNGIDCVGLVQEVFARTGATDAWFFPRTMADYQEHQTGDKILDWLRGKIDDPQSKLLGEILMELPIPDVFKDPDAESPRDFFKPGDILILRHGGLFHMPVIIDEQLHFVNAVPRMGVIEGTIQDSTFSVHLVAAFRLKPK